MRCRDGDEDGEWEEGEWEGGGRSPRMGGEEWRDGERPSNGYAVGAAIGLCMVKSSTASRVTKVRPSNM